MTLSKMSVIEEKNTQNSVNNWGHNYVKQWFFLLKKNIIFFDTILCYVSSWTECVGFSIFTRNVWRSRQKLNSPSIYWQVSEPSGQAAIYNKTCRVDWIILTFVWHCAAHFQFSPLLKLWHRLQIFSMIDQQHNVFNYFHQIYLFFPIVLITILT